MGDKDFHAVLLDQESIKKLNTLLIPTNPLARDVRTLADILGFSNTDINYIIHKPYPFLYMYDQWIKRNQHSAKLSTLRKALSEIMRKDAAEIVEDAIKTLDEQDAKEIMHIEERYIATMQRSISCTTLAMADFSTNDPYEQGRNYSANKEAGIPSLFKQKYPLKETDSVAPDVLVVYTRDNDKHNRFVARFIKRCRKYGIDATDMFDTASGDDRSFYIYSRLVEAQFVFVVCSERFYESSELMLRKAPAVNESEKEMNFIMRFILNDIYGQCGNNPKFIPVLIPEGKEDYIPSVLKCSTIYKMPIDFDNLRRRVFGIEKYKLAPLPATRPRMKPKIIGIKR